MRTDRRTDALSKDRIIEAATELLDTGSESALTFRALAGRLSTGSGAIYWHVADKDQLLRDAADAVVRGVLAEPAADKDPHEAICTLALNVFDAVDARPWVGVQLAREPWQPAMLRIYEGIGRRLLTLRVPEQDLFNAWSVLVNYILGAASQNAAHSRHQPPGTDRTAALSAGAARWIEFAPDKESFIHRIADELAEHDDREQFLAGVGLILAGIVAKI